jgi:hypothetical protein
MDRRTAGATFKHSWDALKKISTTEGLSGSYKGYFATLLSIFRTLRCPLSSMKDSSTGLWLG